MFEPETLRPTRAALHTPESLHGCHVAEFMGYFVEGHAPAAALRRLAAEHPIANGIAMESSTLKADSSVINEATQGSIVLIDREGMSHPWMTGEHGARTELP